MPLQWKHLILKITALDSREYMKTRTSVSSRERTSA